MGQEADAESTYAGAVEAINKSIGKGSTSIDPDSDFFFDRARAEYYGGQRQQAIKDFDSVIKSNPDEAPEAENDLAYFYALDKTNLTEAKALATKALADARRQGDDDVIGMYEDTLAWVDHQEGNNSDALFYEQEAASLTPLFPDIQYHLGEICRAQGLNFQARIAFMRAIKLDPFFPEARASLQSLPPAKPEFNSSVSA
jgi:tetratricopeptide (TPR) repeat protein